MDGLSRLQIITRIAMPLSMPAIASVALYVFMIAWNEFLFAFMFLDDVKLFTLSRGIVSLNSSEVPRQHLMAKHNMRNHSVLPLRIKQRHDFQPGTPFIEVPYAKGSETRIPVPLIGV